MTHPVGPGQPPSPRDEPTAYAIWLALVRVRTAFDWADVARDVEEQLRRGGLTGDVHDRLRKAERERDLAIVERNSAVWQLRSHHARAHGRVALPKSTDD